MVYMDLFAILAVARLLKADCIPQLPTVAPFVITSVRMSRDVFDLVPVLLGFAFGLLFLYAVMLSHRAGNTPSDRYKLADKRSAVISVGLGGYFRIC